MCLQNGRHVANGVSDSGRLMSATGNGKAQTLPNIRSVQTAH
jgi:hypothetical protein